MVLFWRGIFLTRFETITASPDGPSTGGDLKWTRGRNEGVERGSLFAVSAGRLRSPRLLFLGTRTGQVDGQEQVVHLYFSPFNLLGTFGRKISCRALYGFPHIVQVPIRWRPGGGLRVAFESYVLCKCSLRCPTACLR